MAGVEEKGVLLEPVTLDPVPESQQKPPRRAEWLVGLVVLLAAFAWGLSVWFQGEPEEPSPTPEPETPEVVTMDPTPDAVPPEPTPTPVPLRTVLTLISEPPGASVLVGGLFQGVTPLEFESWTEGEAVDFRLTGFAPVRETFPGLEESANMTVVLTEEVAPVRLSGDVEDVVLKINGQLANLPSDGILNLPLRASVLRVEKPGFEVWEQEVSPTRAYQREIRITLVPVQEEKTPPEAPENPQGSREAVVRNTLGIEMVRMNVPMEGAIGAPRGTPGRRTQEAVRKVRLERPFRLAATEVSNAQFARFDPSHSSGTAGSLNLGAPDLPVVRVRWEQAVQFCNWLSTQEGLPPAYVEKDGRWEIEATPGTGYRLPTEAEWEMSMRLHAGGTLYAWGDKMPPPANTVHLAGKESAGVVSTVFQEYEDGARGPVAVAEAYPGPERILGLAGNVREWVHDAFSAPVSGRTLLVDPMGDGGGRFHVMKGAGWRDGRWMDVRIAKRGYGETAADDLGFRVARYVNP